MKALILMLLLTFSWSVSAQMQGSDCYACRTNPDWLRIFNPRLLPFVPEPPLVNITKPDPALKRNDATYCRRKNDVIDTLVFHHTQTLTTTSIREINSMHLDEGADNDPWLMIGYHYTINSAYDKELLPIGIEVSEGRPVDIAGSHAGSDAYKPASAQVKENLSKPGSMMCGKKTGPLKEADDKFKGGMVKANYNTIGIAIIGNYAIKTISNPGGYPANRPRVPSKETLRTAGRLACQLQRENPNIKTIKWHNYYKSTECPGTIKKYISEIIKEAAKEKCIFN